MKRFLLRSFTVGTLVLVSSWLVAGESPQPARSASDGTKRPSLALRAGEDIQDFVFLAEARPLLVRLHVRVDGKPLTDAWLDFMKYLFAYFDLNGDGVLNKQEIERLPNPESLTLGGIALLAGGATKVSIDELDPNKDGKVTLEEMQAYAFKKGFTPFQLQLDLEPADPLAQVGFLGGSKLEPTIADVSKAIFELLDANKDGKLTKDELAAAQPVLLAHDENEDEIVTAKELVPDAKPAGGMRAGMAMRGRPGTSGSSGNQYLVSIPVRGEAPPELAHLMQERYDPSVKGNTTIGLMGKKLPPAGVMSKTQKKEDRAMAKPASPPATPKKAADPKAKPKAEDAKNKEKAKEPPCKLTRKQLGLDEATFAHLDANKDGVLDSKELAAFVKREPDLCLTVSFGDKAGKPLHLDAAAGRPTPLADKLRYRQDNLVLFDLDKTRMELRRNEEERKKNVFSEIIRTQLTALFTAADKDGNGYVDEKEAKATPQFNNVFKAVDRDGNGKVTEKEMLAFFDKMQEIQKRAKDACVTLVLRDQSRGLFELLDTNRDGWLGLRELRQAPKLLERASAQGKGCLTKDDMPRSYLITLRRGTAQSDGLAAQEAIFDRVYGLSYAEEVAATRGPAWFRKMDKNRDGDISRKEFLFSDELFRKIDVDGDGLISVEEAEKAGEVSHK